MSKAEDRALEKYPQKIEWVGNQWNGAPFDVNSKSRVAYKQGYQQAEKDLELTVEDIEEIYLLVIQKDNAYMEANAQNDYQYDVKEMYQEVLKQFKDLKK